MGNVYLHCICPGHSPCFLEHFILLETEGAPRVLHTRIIMPVHYPEPKFIIINVNPPVHQAAASVW